MKIESVITFLRYSKTKKNNFIITNFKNNKRFSIIIDDDGDDSSWSSGRSFLIEKNEKNNIFRTFSMRKIKSKSYFDTINSTFKNMDEYTSYGIKEGFFYDHEEESFKTQKVFRNTTDRHIKYYLCLK